MSSCIRFLLFIIILTLMPLRVVAQSDVFSEDFIITPSGLLSGESFSRSMDLTANQLIVGTPGTTTTGSAFIFTNNGNNWVEQQRLVPSDGSAGDIFGTSVAIEGNTAVVGASRHDGFGNDVGVAYVFTFNGTSWVEQQKLIGSSVTPQGWFGNTIALQGNTLMISARNENVARGAVYVFTFNGTSWVEQQKITIPNADEITTFGHDIALDGNTALISESNNNDLADNAGAAYFFTFDGSSWIQQQKITASDGAESDSFGNSVALSGGTAVIGVPNVDDRGSQAGAAYVFTNNGSSWVEQQKLFASETISPDAFGASVTIVDNAIIVGATRHVNTVGVGAAYVFRQISGNWIEQEKLVPSDARGTFGLEITSEGTTAVIGALGGGGAAYVLTPKLGNCYLSVPQSINENESFTATATCGEVSDTVYGFDFSHSIDVSSPPIFPQTATYNAGDIFASAGSNILTLNNELTLGYAVSLRDPEPAVTISGESQLGSVVYNTDLPGTAVLNLDNLILGNILGDTIPATFSSAATIEIIDLPLAAVSGTATRETGLDTGANITITIDGVPPPEDRIENGIYYFAYLETVALNAELIGNAPGHLECVTSDMSLVDEIENVLLPITLLAGDVNNDGEINITDGAIIVSARIGDPIDPTYTPDVNEDGTINILDLIHVGRNFGETVEACY